MNLRTKKIIAREGLIVAGILITGFLFVGIAKIGADHYSSLLKELPELSFLPDQPVGRENLHVLYLKYNSMIRTFHFVSVIGFLLLVAAYPLYILTRFIIWAIKIVKTKNEK
jgi:hypothetical protein